MDNTQKVSCNTEELWNSINWREVEQYVFKLQKRIYAAAKSNDASLMRQLQKTLTNSYRGKLWAVRKVSQLNKGRNTAGVDGVKSLTSKQKVDLALRLSLNGKSKRVYILKKNGKKRPLGIPTMEERAKQTLVKLALEPEWESKFEPNSYGFRPGRRTHDAKQAIVNSMDGVEYEKWVLDADIKGCFDNINHEKLIQKINTKPSYERQIKSWLKSGLIDWSLAKADRYQQSEMGTPQGGSISPLLANIALHGLEETLKEWIVSSRVYRPQSWSKRAGKMDYLGKTHKFKSLSIVRYADDFVVIHKERDVIEKSQEVIKKFLAEIGLEMSEEKTRIVSNNEGFKFLGFFIKRRQVGNYRSARTNLNKDTGYVMTAIPSVENTKAHYKKLAEVITSHWAASNDQLIDKLNPIIRGWTNYFKYGQGWVVFSKLDHLLYKKLFKWVTRKNKGGSSNEAYTQNWKTVNGVKTFSGKESKLQHHYMKGTELYTKVDGNKSVYDGDDVYWAKRLKTHPLISGTAKELLTKQKGKCGVCKQNFVEGQIWEIDHIKPQGIKGKRIKSNLQLVHEDCHKKKSASEIKLTRNKDLSQEPDEVKISRPVLKTNGNSDVIV